MEGRSCVGRARCAEHCVARRGGPRRGPCLCEACVVLGNEETGCQSKRPANPATQTAVLTAGWEAPPVLQPTSHEHVLCARLIQSPVGLGPPRRVWGGGGGDLRAHGLLYSELCPGFPAPRP